METTCRLPFLEIEGEGQFAVLVRPSSRCMTLSVQPCVHINSVHSLILVVRKSRMLRGVEEFSMMVP